MGGRMQEVKVEGNFQSYVFGIIPTWEEPKRERRGYKNEIIQIASVQTIII